jgi:hypothetical protein
MSYIIEKFQEEAYHIAVCESPKGMEDYWMHQYGRITEPFASRSEAFNALEVWGAITLVGRKKGYGGRSTSLSGFISFEVFDDLVEKTSLWLPEETIKFTIGPLEHPAQIALEGYGPLEHPAKIK